MRVEEHYDLVRMAMRFAAEAHEGIGQVRKYTGEPYINHPAAVVELVGSVAHTPEMLAAAWLHDTVEDTPVTLQDIERTFGSVVAVMVEGLTDTSKPEDGNRAARKAIDRARIANTSPEVKTIKLADLIDNSRSIFSYDRQFAKVYLAEKLLLLEVLKEGDPFLYAMAESIAQEQSAM